MKRIPAVLLLLTLAAPAGGQDMGSDAYKRGDYSTALEKWRPLAEQGYADFQSALGDMYAAGQGVTQDHIEAVKWWRLAAEQGHAASQNKLGVMYSNPDFPDGPAFRRRRAPILPVMAASYGHPGSRILTDATGERRHLRFRQRFRGLQACRPDPSGKSGSKGLGVMQDHAEAVTWYRLAAEQGFALAQFNLGKMYFLGRGVPQDYTEAVTWYRDAADQGFALAQLALGLMYDDGQGVPQDYIQAHVWVSLAASHFSASEKDQRDTAVKLRDAVAAMMTPV